MALLIWLGLRIARRARTRLRVLSRARAVAAGERGIAADLGRHSGSVSAVRRGDAVPELWPHRDAGELCDRRNSAGARDASTGRRSGPAPFHPGLRWVEIVLARAGALRVVGKAAYVQLGQADAIAGQGTLVLQADGGRRYVYNPRLIDAARTLQRGTIYDRTGLPLATSNWAELEQHRAQYKATRDRHRQGLQPRRRALLSAGAADLPSAGRHPHARQLERAEQFAGGARFGGPAAGL